MWTKYIFVYKGQNCNNYAEDIGVPPYKIELPAPYRVPGMCEPLYSGMNS